jgi:hypothetical protein
MEYSVILHDKELKVEVSSRAESALQQRDVPIIADVHLIFGCMIAKRVWFKEQVDCSMVLVNENLGLAFQTVRYKVCSFENIDNGGIPEPFVPGREMKKFMPDSVFIDFKKEQFIGEFVFQPNV